MDSRPKTGGGKKICLKVSERTVAGKEKTKMDSTDTTATAELGGIAIVWNEE